MCRRIVPDDGQVQIILGSLLGGAHIDGVPGERRMRVVHPVTRAGYVWWKYERLGALTADPPRLAEDGIGFATIAHPLFDDLAPLQPARLRQLLAPLGLAVWMSDNGRIEVRAEVFVPVRRAA